MSWKGLTLLYYNKPSISFRISSILSFGTKEFGTILEVLAFVGGGVERKSGCLGQRRRCIRYCRSGGRRTRL